MRSFLAILISALMVAGAAADDRAYSGDIAGNLFLLNFTTGSNTLMGNLGAVGVIGSMTHDPATGLLYAVNTGGDFFHIVPSSATSTFIANLGAGDIEALDMFDGRLIGIALDLTSTIYEIDPATGGLTTLSVTSIGIATGSRGLAMTSAATGYVSDYDTLYSVDFDTGTTVSVGPMAVTGQMHGMDFVNGTLYGVASTSGNFYKVDPGTGNTLFLGNFGANAWYACLAPIEEPVGDWAYSNDNAGNFYSINFNTVTATLLGNTGAVTGNFIESMAYDPDTGMVYAINSSGLLYQIDPATAQATLIGNPGLGNVEALDMFDGKLIAFRFSNPTSTYEINTSTAAATLLAIGINGMNSVPSSAAIESVNRAFLWDRANLVAFDMNTGIATTIGGPLPSMHGMDFVNGTLYGANGSGDLYKIDSGSGNSTLLGSAASTFFLSLAGIDTTIGPVVFTGELTDQSNTWDRIKDTGFIPGPCGSAIAFDSFNDGQPYDEYIVRAINPADPVTVTMRSLELAPADFDPFMAMYCDDFAPGNPTLNVFDTDDDGGTYPDAFLDMTLEANREYRLVASSYASYAPARYGNYELIFTNATVRLPCPPDLNNDGFVDSGDITAFVALFLASDLAVDFNNDGFIDSGDITEFIALFLAGC